MGGEAQLFAQIINDDDTTGANGHGVGLALALETPTLVDALLHFKAGLDRAFDGEIAGDAAGQTRYVEGWKTL